MKKLFLLIAAILTVVDILGNSTIYSDLKWAELKGPVSVVTEEAPESFDHYKEERFYTFGKHGELIYLSINDQQQTIHRDSIGRISNIYANYPLPLNNMDDPTIDLGVEYSYNEEGLPSKESWSYLECWDEISNLYNDRGWKIFSKGQAVGDCDDSERDYYYTYNNIDAHGNWQTRKAHVLITDYEGKISKIIIITNRMIFYYDE